MNNRYRLLCAFLALLLICSVTATAFAEEENQVWEELDEKYYSVYELKALFPEAGITDSDIMTFESKVASGEKTKSMLLTEDPVAVYEKYIGDDYIVLFVFSDSSYASLGITGGSRAIPSQGYGSYGGSSYTSGGTTYYTDRIVYYNTYSGGFGNLAQYRVDFHYNSSSGAIDDVFRSSGDQNYNVTYLGLSIIRQNASYSNPGQTRGRYTLLFWDNISEDWVSGGTLNLYFYLRPGSSGNVFYVDYSIS